ncbi:hypothetical protein REJ21_003888 [Salmonella enterica]|nr:hypothetical protein [Salmonella enterica]
MDNSDLIRISKDALFSMQQPLQFLSSLSELRRLADRADIPVPAAFCSRNIFMSDADTSGAVFLVGNKEFYVY